MSRKLKTVSATDSSNDNEDIPIDRIELMLTKVTKILSDTFNSCVEKLIASLDEKLTLKLDIQSSEIFDANKRIDALEKRLINIELENAALRGSLQSVNSRVDSTSLANDDLDQYMRSENLILHGVPLPIDGSREVDISQVVIDVINSNMPGVALKKEQISTAHRMGQSGTRQNSQSPNAASSTSRPPAIIIRFCQRDARNKLLQGRRQLKGKNVSLTEQLTPRRAQLLKKANELVSRHKLESAWSHDGKILVKTSSNRTVLVSTDLDLLQFSSG